MKNGDVVFSLVDYAKEFVQENQNLNIEQKVIEAIIVDYINYFVAMQCGMDLALYTKDLKNGKKMGKEEVVLEKNIIVFVLNSQKEQYDKSGIVESVNRNCHMNECCRKAKVDNMEAIKLIDTFINGYLAA